ncbi:MAG: amino acid permease [Planctomycetes bacterium]|nr:amino acid permease [Planctomycetota bacterium]
MGPRKLSAFDATLLVVGGIVGVGIFYNPSRIAAAVPDPGWYLALWVFGALVAVHAALVFAELGAAYPQAGGWYVFLRAAFGPFPAFLFAFVVLGVVATGASAVMMEICVANLAGIVPGVGPPGTAAGQVAGAVILVLVTALALAGVKAGALLQNGCTLIKLAAIAALALGAWIVFEPGSVQPTPPPPPPEGGLGAGALRALLPIFFAYGGWQMVCYVAPEVRDPSRTLPRAILLGVAIVAAAYLAINAGYLRVLGLGGLAADPAFAGEFARRTLGPTGGEILRAAMGVSALGVCVVTILTSPWLFVAMAREGLFFERFGRLHPRTGAPVAALCVQLTLALGYWLWGGAGFLVDNVVFVEWIFHGLVAAAFLRLRRLPGASWPFRSRFGTWAAWVYLLTATAVVAGNLQGDAVWIGGVVLALGAIVYRPWRALVARRAVGSAS